MQGRISTIYSPTIDTEYNVIQIADYDVDSFVGKLLK